MHKLKLLILLKIAKHKLHKAKKLQDQVQRIHAYVRTHS